MEISLFDCLTEYWEFPSTVDLLRESSPATEAYHALLACSEAKFLHFSVAVQNITLKISEYFDFQRKRKPIWDTKKIERGLASKVVPIACANY